MVLAPVCGAGRDHERLRRHVHVVHDLAHVQAELDNRVAARAKRPRREPIHGDVGLHRHARGGMATDVVRRMSTSMRAGMNPRYASVVWLASGGGGSSSAVKYVSRVLPRMSCIRLNTTPRRIVGAFRGGSGYVWTSVPQMLLVSLSIKCAPAVRT
ncbi:hypothetical protein H257_09661, partial [Aphanomyces astaci]